MLCIFFCRISLISGLACLELYKILRPLDKLDNRWNEQEETEKALFSKMKAA